MLIQPDINELGDKRLDPKEGVAQKREECLAMAASRRLPHQEDIEDPMRAFGPRLQFTELLSRLRRVNPTLRALDGSPGNIALYAPRTNEEIAERKPEWEQEQVDRASRCLSRQDPFFLHHKYVGGFPKSELQEYSTVDIDNAMLATKENRGWRSVLMNLVMQGVAGYKDVVKEFGDTGTDRRGWRWREQLKAYKN